MAVDVGHAATVQDHKSLFVRIGGVPADALTGLQFDSASTHAAGLGCAGEERAIDCAAVQRQGQRLAPGVLLRSEECECEGKKNWRCQPCAFHRGLSEEILVSVRVVVSSDFVLNVLKFFLWLLDALSSALTRSTWGELVRMVLVCHKDLLRVWMLVADGGDFKQLNLCGIARYSFSGRRPIVTL